MRVFPVFIIRGVYYRRRGKLVNPVRDKPRHGGAEAVRLRRRALSNGVNPLHIQRALPCTFSEGRTGLAASDCNTPTSDEPLVLRGVSQRDGARVSAPRPHGDSDPAKRAANQNRPDSILLESGAHLRSSPE